MFIPDYLKQPPAWFHARILVGPGAFLTQRFAAEQTITHVINCADDDACPEWFSTRFPEKYACLNAIDSPCANILYWYPTFEAVLRRFLREPNSGVIYVHCVAGMNRSGSLALAYVGNTYHLPVEDLIVATQRQRPCLFQNTVYRNQVKDFLNGRVSSQEAQGAIGQRILSGNSGLSPSIDHSSAEGDQRPAGHDAGRT